MNQSQKMNALNFYSRFLIAQAVKILFPALYYLWLSPLQSMIDLNGLHTIQLIDRFEGFFFL